MSRQAHMRNRERFRQEEETIIVTLPELQGVLLKRPKTMEQLSRFISDSRIFSWASLDSDRALISEFFTQHYQESINTELKKNKIYIDGMSTCLADLLQALIKNPSYNEAWAVKTLTTLMQQENNKTFIFLRIEDSLYKNFLALKSRSCKAREDKEKVVSFMREFRSEKLKDIL